MISIGERQIGKGAPCFLIAEVGINHNGDMDLARRSIEVAAKTGVDAVKFQNFLTEDFIKDRTSTYTYTNSGKKVVERQYDMFKRCELAPDQLAMLARTCRDNGVVFTSTPTSDQGVDDLVAVGAPLIKNGSDYLSNLPLLVTMARTNLPTILSTGLASLADIDDSVQAFRAAGGRDLILLHCISSYPAPMNSVHLGKIPALAGAFGCDVGFSDHTQGIVAALGAVAIGACVIEKHFTLDRDMPGPDHSFSSDPDELRQLVQGVRDLEAALVPAPLGVLDGNSKPKEYRLSCVAATDLPAGHVLNAHDIAFARPGSGIPPKHADWLIGVRLSRAVADGHVLSLTDFR